MPKEKMPSPVSPIQAGSSTVNPAVNTFSPFYTVTIEQEPIVDEGRPRVTVYAHIPEEISLDTSSEYDTPFADGLISDRRLQTIAQVAGWSPTVQAMTAQFWKGSSPMELQLPLVLVAYKDGSEISDAVLKLKSLQMPRVDPKTKFLRPPGPRLSLNQAAAGAMLDATTETAKAVYGQMTTPSSSGDGGGSSADASKPSESTLSQMGASISKGAQKMADNASKLIEVKGKISVRVGKFLYFSDVLVRNVGDQYNIILGPDGKPQKVTINLHIVTRVTPTYDDLAEIYCTDNPIQTSPLVGKP